MERDELPADAANRRTSLLLAAAAGVGFGFSFVCYGNTRDASEFWPVLSGRVGAVLAVLLVVAVTRTHVRLDGTPRVQAIAAGALDVIATALLLVAIRNGLFATVAPVAALAPRSPSPTRGGTCASDPRGSSSPASYSRSPASRSISAS